MTARSAYTAISPDVAVMSYGWSARCWANGKSETGSGYSWTRAQTGSSLHLRLTSCTGRFSTGRIFSPAACMSIIGCRMSDSATLCLTSATKQVRPCSRSEWNRDESSYLSNSRKAASLFKISKNKPLLRIFEKDSQSEDIQLLNLIPA